MDRASGGHRQDAVGLPCAPAGPTDLPRDLPTVTAKPLSSRLTTPLTHKRTTARRGQEARSIARDPALCLAGCLKPAGRGTQKELGFWLIYLQ